MRNFTQKFSFIIEKKNENESITILTYKNLFDRISCLVLSSKILSVAFHNQCSRHIFHAKIYPSKWSGTGEKDNISSIFLKRYEIILEI